MVGLVENKEQLFSLIIQNNETIKAYGVKKIGLFGSFVRNQQKKNSDIDLVVEFYSNKKTYKNFISLIYYLEELSGRKVEIVTPGSISPYIEPYIMEEIEYVPILS